MPAQVIDGKKLALQIEDKVAAKAGSLPQKPVLSVILAGSNEASKTYVRLKTDACNRVGLECKDICLPEDADHSDLIAKLQELNNDPSVNAILVQLPLPDKFDRNDIAKTINPKKDADGVNPFSGITPATPKGIIYMLESIGFEFGGKDAVTIGRSSIVGRPLSELLLQKDCTVTICHSKTKDLAEHTKRADLIVSAAGSPSLVTADMVKSGAIVIDVGISKINGKLVGDVDYDSVKEVSSYITRVIGGVGPVTVAMLLHNVVECYVLQNA